MTSSAYSMDLSKRIYEMWHEKEPRELVSTPAFTPPRNAYAVGTALFVIYKSDKWEEDGDFVDYVHKFTSRPTLWATTGVLLGEEDPEAFDMVRTTELVPEFAGGGGRSLKRLGFPMLAKALSLTYFDGVRKRKISFKSHKPILSCSLDRRTVIFFADELLFVHGGNTKVLADGIAY